MKKVEIGGGGGGRHRTGLYTYLARTKACMFLGCNVWAASSATYSLLSWYNTLISLLSPPPYFFFPFQKKVSKETSEHWVLHVTFSQAVPIFYMLFTHLLTYQLYKSYRSLGYNLPTILKKKKEKSEVMSMHCNVKVRQSPVSCWSRWLISQCFLTLMSGKYDCAVVSEVCSPVEHFEFYDNKIRRGSNEVQSI